MLERRGARQEQNISPPPSVRRSLVSRFFSWFSLVIQDVIGVGGRYLAAFFPVGMRNLFCLDSGWHSISLSLVSSRLKGTF